MAIKDILKMYSLSPSTTTTEDGRMLALSLAEIQTELMALREELGKSSPTPTTVISEIDTSSLEAAIAQLKPLPPQNLDLNPVFRSYAETNKVIKELLGEIKTTNHRISGLGFGSGGAGNERVLTDIKRRISDTENRLDYDTRLDANPVYVGKAVQGTLTSSPLWTIQKLEYDASDRLIRTQVLTAAWDSRTTLDWT